MHIVLEAVYAHLVAETCLLVLGISFQTLNHGTAGTVDPRDERLAFKRVLIESDPDCVVFSSAQ